MKKKQTGKKKERKNVVDWVMSILEMIWHLLGAK